MKLIITKNDILEKFNLPVGIEVEIEGETKTTRKVPKLTTEKFSEFLGKPRKELYEHLKKEYADKLPGEDEICDIFKNPEKYPKLKDGNYYYFFGAAFCNTDGLWNVPCVHWVGSKFDRNGSWLDNDWNGRDRVVFLEIAP